MELHEIEVVIAPDGTTTVQVRGLAGAGCLDLTAGLEQALGGEVLSRELTAEAQAGLERTDPARLRQERER